MALSILNQIIPDHFNGDLQKLDSKKMEFKLKKRNHSVQHKSNLLIDKTSNLLINQSKTVNNDEENTNPKSKVSLKSFISLNVDLKVNNP